MDHLLSSHRNLNNKEDTTVSNKESHRIRGGHLYFFYPYDRRSSFLVPRERTQVYLDGDPVNGNRPDPMGWGIV